MCVYIQAVAGYGNVNKTLRASLTNHTHHKHKHKHKQCVYMQTYVCVCVCVCVCVITEYSRPPAMLITEQKRKHTETQS